MDASSLSTWPMLAVFKALLSQAQTSDNPVVNDIAAAIDRLASNELPTVGSLTVLTGQLMIAVETPASRPAADD